MLEVTDDLDAINALACERGWADGLPIVPPTQERVQSVLDYLHRDPGDEIAVLPPRMGVATVQQIAVNTVMAGCLPEYAPVVIAAIEAVADPVFNLAASEVDVNPVAPLTIVNGPIRKAIRMNWGRNALGEGNRANATIGRALRLVLLNTGGAKPGILDMAIHGQPGKYVFCMAEDEDSNPWEPLHVERGLKREDSAVTVVAATGTINVLTGGCYNFRDMLKLIANAMSYMGSNNVMLGQGGPLVLLSPGHANMLRRDRLSRDNVKRLLYEYSGFPAAQLPRVKRRERINAVEKDGWIRPVRQPEDILIVVAGGAEPNHALVIPTYGDAAPVTRHVRIPTAK